MIPKIKKLKTENRAGNALLINGKCATSTQGSGIGRWPLILNAEPNEATQTTTRRFTSSRVRQSCQAARAKPTRMRSIGSAIYAPAS